jgi:GNAT superfamily N-acetyltransferase
MTKTVREDVRLGVEPPGSPDAQACRDAYFAELDRRFEGGFDLALGKAAHDEDMIAPAGIFLVARLGGLPVGCGGFTRLETTTAEIKRMWVSDTTRGRGIARMLLRELERLAKGAGHERVRLDTNRVLTQAHALYRNEGYAEVPRYNDNPYAHLFFEKRLRGLP